MAKKKDTKVKPAPGKDGAEHYVEWGETNQERILEETSRAQSQRHRCKGPKCVDAFKVS